MKTHSCYFTYGVEIIHNGRIYRFQRHETDTSNNRQNRYYSFFASIGNDFVEFPAGKYETVEEIHPKLTDRLMVLWQTVIIPISTVLLILFFIFSFYLMTVRESGSVEAQRFWFGTEINK